MANHFLFSLQETASVFQDPYRNMSALKLLLLSWSISPFIFPNFLTQENFHWLEENCSKIGRTKKIDISTFTKKASRTC